MIRSSRHIKALVLAVIYLLITLSPLAPFALQSTAIAHAVTGECAGNCSVCNCSPERSANHTCCCWQKKLKHEHDQEPEQVPDCCKKMQKDTAPTLTCNSPCGNDKPLLFGGTEKLEQLPYHFTDGLPLANEELITPRAQHRLTDHLGDPPDYPPKPVFIS